MYQYTYEAGIDDVFITEPYMQQKYRYNDDKDDASLWATLFKEKQPDRTTLVARDGIAGVSVDNVICIGGHCSPNVKMKQFDSNIQELDTLIQATKWSYPAMMIAGILTYRPPHEHVCEEWDHPDQDE